MKKLTDGVYDLESSGLYDLSLGEMLALADEYGEGIERMVAMAVLTCCHTHGRWVGVSIGKILEFVVGLKLRQEGIGPDDHARILHLTIRFGQEAIAAIGRGLGMKTSWIREVGDRSVGKSDSILALAITRISNRLPEPSAN